MKFTPSKQYFAAAHRVVADSDTIEWEELPSLAASLAQRLVARGALAHAATGSLARLINSAEAGSAHRAKTALSAPSHAVPSAVPSATPRTAARTAPEPFYVAPWQSTVQGTFYELEPATPFREVLFGVSTREVHEPDVFEHFFGAGAHRR